MSLVSPGQGESINGTAKWTEVFDQQAIRLHQHICTATGHEMQVNASTMARGTSVDETCGTASHFAKVCMNRGQQSRQLNAVDDSVPGELEEKDVYSAESVGAGNTGGKKVVCQPATAQRGPEVPA